MKKIYLVVDQKGAASLFSNYQEAKQKFENMVGACRAVNAYNNTFKCRFNTIEVDETQTIKQFRANYKIKEKWTNEIFSLYIITTQN